MTTLLAAAFMMGFLGSPHCLGMCGGIISAFGISMGQASNAKKYQLTAIYHLGRLLSYAFIGAIASLVGSAVFAPLFQNSAMPRILVGISLLFVGAMMMGLPILNKLERLGLGLWQKLSPLRQKLFPLNTAPKALFAGLLWGFLPCGLVYGAVFVAISSATQSTDTLSNVGFGAIFMMIFGLGTLPLLLATQSIIAMLQNFIKRFSLRKFSGAIMTISGLLVAIPAIMHAGHHHGHHHHSHHHSHDTGHHHHHHSHDNHNHQDTSHHNH